MTSQQAVSARSDVQSEEESTKVAPAVPFELVLLDRNKDLVLHQVLDRSAAGRLLVSAQLAAELPLPACDGGHVSICAAAFSRRRLNRGGVAAGMRVR